MRLDAVFLEHCVYSTVKLDQETFFFKKKVFQSVLECQTNKIYLFVIKSQKSIKHFDRKVWFSDVFHAITHCKWLKTIKLYRTFSKSCSIQKFKIRILFNTIDQLAIPIGLLISDHIVLDQKRN